MIKPGLLRVEAYEAAAMLSGTMVQKRVPGPDRFWKVGQLRWVQEPFTEWVGSGRRDEAKFGISYHADHQGSTLMGLPDHMRHANFKPKVRGAEMMSRGLSRLTVEIEAIRKVELGTFTDRDEFAEGFEELRRFVGDNTLATFRRNWEREHGTVWRPREIVLLLKFKVHKANVAQVMGAAA